jgi:hypothetical protein
MLLNLRRDVELMKSIGVASDNDFKDFYFVSIHIKSIAEDLLNKKLNNELLAKLATSVYQNRDKYPINNIINFYIAVEKSCNENMITIKKIAYPQGTEAIYIHPPYNIPNWIQAMKAIYIHANHGISMDHAFDLVTEKWDKMSKQDFKNWMAFYQQDGHKAYKKASSYLEVGNGAYLPVDINDLRGQIPGIPSRIPDMSQYDAAVAQDAQLKKKQEAVRENEEKEELKRQVKALIGRLNSAERIATSKGIDKVLGPVYETWLKALHDLKREIQIAPLRNVKSSLLEDLMIRKANQLIYAGYNVPGRMILKLAQMAPPPLEQKPEEGKEKPEIKTEEKKPSSDLPEAPVEELTMPPLEMGNMDEMGEMNESAGSEWIEEFLQGLSGIVEDVEDVEDEDNAEADDDLYVDEDDLVVTAQAVPPAPSPEKNINPGAATPLTEIEKALATVTVHDVIDKLESLSNLFKNREISRQLSLVDMMMDSLGIASYFPNLAEATQRSLDANQYMLTRVEDVLAKLRGTVETSQKIDLHGDVPPPAATNGGGVAQQLDVDSAKEEERKLAREKAREAEEDAQIAQQSAPPAPGAEVAQSTPAIQPGQPSSV